MPDSGEKDLTSDEVGKKNAASEKKHDSGAADLEKVTDYAEEKEIVSNSTDLSDAIANIRNKQAAEVAERIAKEKELNKIQIKKEDVDLIVEELEIPRAMAERTLREHQGSVVEALCALTDV